MVKSKTQTNYGKKVFPLELPGTRIFLFYTNAFEYDNKYKKISCGCIAAGVQDSVAHAL